MRCGSFAFLLVAFLGAACADLGQLQGGATGEGGAEGGLDAASEAPLTSDGRGDAPLDARGDSGLDSGLDAPVSMIDASGDAPADAPPDAPTTCSSNPPDDSIGVFVASGGSDTAPCTRALPCATVSFGLSHAAATGKSAVYVGPGAYVETPTLVGGVSVQGGWSVTGTTWTHDCNASDVTILTTTSDRVVSANGLSAQLSDLTIANRTMAGTGSAGAGVTLYGIFSVSSALKLDNVIVQVAQGGSGGDSHPGASGINGGTGCASGTGTNGSPAGLPGTGAGPGVYSSAGYAPSSGMPGGDGVAGDNGTPAGGGTCATVTSCVVSGDAGTGCTAQPSMEMACSSPGTNGCGGAGGGGAAGGGGGGASLGVFVWAGMLSLNGGSIAAQNGGAGGSGGIGGSGGVGSIGAAGLSQMYQDGCEPGATPPTCSTLIALLPGGTPGGAGGQGSSGGTGGGGSGGDSYAFYAGGGASVMESGTALSFGVGGAGGTGGTSGADGSASQHN